MSKKLESDWIGNELAAVRAMNLRCAETLTKAEKHFEREHYDASLNMLWRLQSDLNEIDHKLTLVGLFIRFTSDESAAQWHTLTGVQREMRSCVAELIDITKGER